MVNLQKSIEHSIKAMEVLMIDNPTGWVVESENHVCVGKEDGLNGTTFNVKCPANNHGAIIYDTEENAEKFGFDYYLVDGKGNPVYMIATKATEFFQREIDRAKKLLVNISNLPYNKL